MSYALHALFITPLTTSTSRNDNTTVLQDRASIEQMKADILRRAEAMFNEEKEEVLEPDGKGKGIDVAFEDELDDLGSIQVRDGQASDDERGEESEEEGTEVSDLGLCARLSEHSG